MNPQNPNQKKFSFKGRKGQAGLIILLALAFGLIFYAAASNIGRISQTKTQTQIAAMAGASKLASQMSSYGQYLFETQLGGRKRICAPSGVLMAIILVVVIIVLIIITICTWGGASPAWGLVGTLLGVGAAAAQAITIAVLAVALTMALANVVLQVAVIQPALTKMWNKVIQDTMGIADQFSEQGILAGLSNIVTDNKQVPDMYDFDNDFVWGYGTDGKPKDRISRFGYYYTKERLEDIVIPNLPAIDQFMNQLRDFVYKNPKPPYADPAESPKWGLYDPPDCKDNPGHECCYDPTDANGDGEPDKVIPAYCNPCCVSARVPNPLKDDNPETQDEFVSARPACCDCVKNGSCPPDKQCGVSTTCAATSPYGTDYPYVYNRYFENSDNNFPRKRIKLAPEEDPNVASLDGLNPLPDPTIQVGLKLFDRDSCPGAVPYVEPDGIFHHIWFGSYFSFGDKLCPKGFVAQPLPPLVQPAGTYYAGKCDGTVKLSAINAELSTYTCVAIDQPENAFISFKEELGTDDENKNYIKNPQDPNGIQIKVTDPTQIGFHVYDTTGYYSDPEYTAAGGYSPDVADLKKGIFPFFYKIKDWGLDIGELDTTPGLTVHPEHCYWYDEKYSSKDGLIPPHPCNLTTGALYDQQPMGLRPQLVLPIDPQSADPDPKKRVVFNTTNYVDNVSIAGRPALKPDHVSLPSDTNPYGTRGIVAKDEMCADQLYPLDSISEKIGFWKAGADRYCQPPGNEEGWPYFAHCAKHRWDPEHPGCVETVQFQDIDGDGVVDEKDQDEKTPVDCYCSAGGSDPKEFPEDVLDSLVYNINDFLDFSRILFRKWESQKRRLGLNFKYWYPDIAEWIEPQKGKGLCFICEEDTQGELWTALDAIKEIRTRLELWRDANYFGQGCDDVWCSPSSCSIVQNDEALSMTSAPGVQGVVNCLSYNLDNAKRFQTCLDACSTAELRADTTIPFRRADPVNNPGATADGYIQMENAGLCGPLPRSLITRHDAVTNKDMIFDPSGEFKHSSPARLQELLGCEYKDYDPYYGFMGCIGKLKQANQIRCWDELNCEARYGPTCELRCTGMGLQDCKDICQSNSDTCNFNCDTYTRDGGLTNCNNDFNACWTNCTLQEADCNSKCTTGPCFTACNTEKVNVCQPGCSDTRKACRDKVLNDYYPNCQATCTYWADQCNTDCLDTSDDPAPGPTCVQKCFIKRQNCYSTAESTWNQNRTDFGTCGGATGQAFSCFNDVHTDIEWYWTGNGCMYPDQRADFGYPIDTNKADHSSPLVDPDDKDPAPPTVDFTDGPEGIQAQKGSCIDTAPGGIIDLITQSIPEAENQSAKFKTRRDFLANRLGEANEVITIFREAELEFTQFLENAARDLIQLRIDFDKEESGLPYHIIYGWQGPPPEDSQISREGYWHIIKVEARTPDKCDKGCWAPERERDKNNDPKWPRVKSYTKGTSRCYELVNTNGIVKYRVTRFDQDRDPTSGNSKFPSGQKIWDFRFFNPLRGKGDVSNLGIACQDRVIPNPPPSELPVAASSEKIFGGAFLLNKSDDSPGCWQKANELLSHGASTEVCAQYYFHMGNPKGMSHQFIKCPTDDRPTF